MIEIAIAAGSGVFYEQSRLLLKSIESNVDEPYGTTIFLPEQDVSDLSSRQVSFYENHGDLVTGAYPIENHKMSAKQAALREAEKKDADLYVLLDCDTLVLDELKPITRFDDGESRLLLCPEHGGWPHWATRSAENEWHDIYTLIDAEFPGYTMRSVFDDSPIPPYWNGGVVVTKGEIAKEWLELIRALRQRLGSDLFYAEQLALPLLGHKYGVSPLPVEYNYPSYMYLQCPSDVSIIHYSELWHLSRILNPDIIRTLDEIGAYELEEVARGVNRIKALGHGAAVRGFRELVRKQWPKIKRTFSDR